jgi:hypothetical protein
VLSGRALTLRQGWAVLRYLPWVKTDGRKDGQTRLRKAVDPSFRLTVFTSNARLE